MKRVLLLIAALAILALTAVSCRSTYDCPAYGETHKYQIEQRY